MTLEEIRTVLKFRDAPEEDCGEVNTLLDEHLAHVVNRIGDLKELERQLKSLRKLCASVQPSKHCKILHELASSTLRSSTNERDGHVRGAHAHNKRFP